MPDAKHRPFQSSGRVRGATPPRPLEGPDFLCVGMPKAGTTWLYDQLNRHARFWMPPIKELHIFDLHRGERADHYRRQRSGHDGFRATEFDSFAEQADAVAGLADYARLFAPKCDRLSGDVTPGYAVLREPEIAHIKSAFPQVKVMLLLRNPIERLWSAIGGHVAKIPNWQDPKTRPALWARALMDPRVAKYPSAPTVYRRWGRHFDVITAFYEHIAADPTRARRRVARLLTRTSPAADDFSVEPHYNRNRGTAEPMWDMDRAILSAHFAQEIEESGAVFGGPANGWARKYAPRPRLAAR